MSFHDRTLVLSLLLALSFGGAALAQDEVSFSGASWHVRGDAKIEPYEGFEVLRVRTGWARLAGVEFENGTIEMDMRTTGHRSFVGVGFRGQDDDREDFYLRPHNSGKFDAMQYTPVYHGIAGWRLYPEHNATFHIPADRWLHVKLVVAGPRLDVFLDRSKEPALSVARLMRGRSRGAVELWSNFPESETLDLFPTAYANVVVKGQTRG